jgi:type I restriction enzyme, R subunit
VLFHYSEFMSSAPPASPNFGFLARYDAALVLIAARAEQYFPSDPVTALMKLRQFGELLAQQIAARTNIYTTVDEPQAELLARMRRENAIPREAVDLFHDLRRAGNDATHGHVGDHATAMAALKLARQLAIFFHKTFGDPRFKPGPFQPPRAPVDASAELQAEIERLKAERDASLTAAERAREDAQQQAAAAEAAASRGRSSRQARTAPDASRCRMSRPRSHAAPRGAARDRGRPRPEMPAL